MSKNRKPKPMRGNKNRKPCVSAARMPREESDALLEEALAQLYAAAHRTEPFDAGRAAPPEKLPLPALEGDGEEVFGQMVDDLLYTASLLDALYGILFALAERRMCSKFALEQGAGLVKEVDEILEKWQRYSLPEA